MGARLFGKYYLLWAGLGLLAAIIFLLSGYLSSVNEQAAEAFLQERELTARNEALTESLSQTINEQFGVISAILDSFAGNPEVARLIEINNDWEEAVDFLAPVVSEGLVDHVFLTDTEGIVMSDFPRSSSVRGWNLLFPDGSIRPDMVAFGPHFLETVRWAFPVRNTKGMPVAVLVAQISTATLTQLLTDIKANSDITIYVIDQNRRIVAQPGPGQMGQFIDFSSDSDVRRVFTRGPGSRVTAFGSVRSVSSWRYLPELRWGLIIKTRAAL